MPNLPVGVGPDVRRINIPDNNMQRRGAGAKYRLQEATRPPGLFIANATFDSKFKTKNSKLILPPLPTLYPHIPPLLPPLPKPISI